MSAIRLPFDNYGFSYLTAHLSRAGFADELFRLVTSSIWWENSRVFDPSRQSFKNDIDITYRSIERTVRNFQLEIDDRKPLGEKLSWLSVLAFISARLGQRASRIPPSILEALARLGHVEQAVKLASTNPDYIKRIESLIWIGLAEFQQGHIKAANDIWEDVYLLLINLQPDIFGENFAMLGDLATTLAISGNKDKAMTVTSKLEETLHAQFEKSGGISSTARFALIKALISTNRTNKAMQLIHEFDNPEDMVAALWKAAHTQIALKGIIERDFIKIAKALRQKTENATARIRLAEILASAGQIHDAWKMIAQAQGPINQSWILRSYLYYLLCQGNTAATKQVSQQIVDLVASIPDSPLRLEHCSALLLGRQRSLITPFSDSLLLIMQQDLDSIPGSIDATRLGWIALSLSILGDFTRAQAVIDKVTGSKFEGEDWDEAYSLIKFAQFFGESNDPNRLRQLLEIVTRREDLWQKTEILTAVARYSLLLKDEELATDTTKLLSAICEDQQAIAARPNAMGALAVWKWESNPLIREEQVEKLLNQAIIHCQADDDKADALALLALSLADTGLREWAVHIVNAALQSVQMDQDPNTVARMIGTLSEVAIRLKNHVILDQLKIRALSITDDWLQAEALFWISSGFALLKTEQEARKLFVHAFKLGAWNEVEVSRIDLIWAEPKSVIEYFLDNQAIGWHSTKVAAICAWMAIAISDPQPLAEFLSAGVQLISLIPEEYSEKRSFCLGLLASCINANSHDDNHLIDLYCRALEPARARHVGEVWAVFHSCFSFLQGYFGKEFVETIWDQLMQAQGIYD